MRSKPAGFVLSRREREKALNEKIWTIYYAVMSGVQARRKPGIPTQISQISTFNKMALKFERNDDKKRGQRNIKHVDYVMIKGKENTVADKKRKIL